MTHSHFNHLAEKISFHLSKASQSISAAVCWFSHTDIFEVLKERIRAGVKVELLIEFDSRNIREYGLDFQGFIGLGGTLYAHCDAGLMHHKFAIVDHRLLLTGSFNWTYNSNAENLLVTDESCVVAVFQREFERQQIAARRIFTIKKEEVKLFSAFPIFENTNFQKVDLRKKIASGCAIWIVRSDKMKFDKAQIMQEYLLPFDRQHLLANYWQSTQLFDKVLLEAEWNTLSSGLPLVQLRELRLFALRMKTGDIVLLAGKKKQLNAIGVIQSEPGRYSGDSHSSAREIQWLKILPEASTLTLQKKGFLQAVGRFRGSGLRLLEEVFDKAAFAG